MADAVTGATGVTLAALAADGLLTGLSLDKVLVQLPARHRIGPVAYAAYARSADLGNGIVFYGIVGISAASLTVGAFAVGIARHSGRSATTFLGAAAALSLLHSIATARAAPTMFEIGRTADSEEALAPLLAKFARWSTVRAALQAATLVATGGAAAVQLMPDRPTQPR